MAGLEVTPTDELTGLPLPLVPLEDFGRDPNWHHHFHPKKDPALAKGLGGQAVRQCRLQKYNYDLHSNEYHHNYSGPPLPRTTQDKFVTVVMAVAGYMPHYAIDMRGGSPEVVRLNYDQRHHLQTSGEMRIGADSIVRKFMREYILDHGFDVVSTDELAVEEFMETEDLERRMELGHNLLGIAIDRATEPADDAYYTARKNELLKPGVAGNAQRFIKAKLGPRKSRDNIVAALHEQLVGAFA